MDRLTGNIANTLCEYLSPDKAREAAQKVMVKLSEEFAGDVRPTIVDTSEDGRLDGESEQEYGQRMDREREQRLNAAKDASLRLNDPLERATAVWKAG